MSEHERLIDISVALGPGTPEWPGDAPYSCGWTATIAGGAAVNLSALTMSPHVGTHADAPLHVRDDWPGSEALPPHVFVGPAVVLDVSDAPAAISLDEIAARAQRAGVVLAGVTRLLLRTGRTVADGRFPGDWPCLAPDCATALAAGGLLLLGVDSPSVDSRDSRDLAVHHALFGGGALNLESLDLRRVTSGEYELLAAPLRIIGLDAAPVRALLRPLAPIA